MRKLTLKDFLSFYAPCLSCGNKNNLSWIVIYKNKQLPPNYNLGEFSPNINGKLLEIDLKTTYFEKFSLMIDIVSHNFISSDASQMMAYAMDTDCQVQLKCMRCNSQVISSKLEFDFNKRILLPLTVKGEIWHITDSEYMYGIFTNTDSGQSEIIVDKISSATPLSPWRKILDAIYINKFSSKEEFLERIKTYMVFS